MFITFEGIEGTGKTTQIERLTRHLSGKGCSVIQTREPGGTDFGQMIRSQILDPKTTFANRQTELLLFYADRLEHVSAVVQPALDANKIVLCDRFVDSTVAYQIGGRGMPSTSVDALNTFVNMVPDLTILFDLKPEEALRRAKKRAALDRFEEESLAFHHRVRDAYLALAAENPGRVCVIDVNGLNPDEVFATMMATITDPLKGRGLQL